MKSILSFLVLLFTVKCSLSQSGDSARARNNILPGVRNITKLSFLSPGFSYELKIAKSQTLYARAYIDLSGYAGYSSEAGTIAGIFPDPAFTIQYRYYYNFTRRETKGKRTDMNSANYLAPVFKSTFNIETTDYSLHRFGIVWGMQRNYHSRFSIDLNVGIGYSFLGRNFSNADELFIRDPNTLTTMGQINLGFWLNKRT